MGKKKAVLLLSGGIDSSTCGAIATALGFEVYAISFNYGQRHVIELEAAEKVVKFLGIKEHKYIKSDLSAIGGSALTDNNIEVPDFKEGKNSIPSTYVPSRNIIFLSYAVSYAEVIGAGDIFTGVTAVDYSGYPDCRPDFIKTFNNAVNLGTKRGIGGKPFKIHTPLIELSKKDIIIKGINLGFDYGLTHSCYNPDINGIVCGKCDSCILRKKGFEEAGVDDPALKI